MTTHFKDEHRTACGLFTHPLLDKILIWTTVRGRVDCQACLFRMYPNDPNRRRSWRRRNKDRGW